MKIGLLLICTGEGYWPYATQLIESARVHFLPGKKVDFLLWSDMPPEQGYGVNKIFPTEHTHWPYPTLMRYHLFLQQDEILKDYDYLFYCDIDMVFANPVGEEVLGPGLTAAEHPMYHFRPGLRFPLEPNPLSAAYIKVPPFYYAGGFQGGQGSEFLKAMRAMTRQIDADFAINYIARWNDESHWNKYLFDNPPARTLGPDYIYPDSLIKEYYEPIWGQAFVPKLITLTKKFSTSKEGGAAVAQAISDLKPLQL